METNFLTSLEIKTKLSQLYEDSISSICKKIDKIGRESYSINGYWMSSVVSLSHDGNIIGPRLFQLTENEGYIQVERIGKYRNGSGSSFEIRLYYDNTTYIVLPKEMNVNEFQYRSTGDFLPTITILRSLEYIESTLM